MIFKAGNENGKNGESLLSVPSQELSPLQFVRKDTSYKNLSQKYLLGNAKNSSRQYCEMYSARLDMMREIVEKRIQHQWGSIKIRKLHELNEQEGNCAIVGILYKRQELKPSILKELSEENQLMPQPILEKFTSDTDEIILEDELQRIQLKGNINIGELVTGIVCGVKGHEEAGGKFHVEDICYAGLPDDINSADVSDERFIAFISGIELNNEASFLPLQLLVDHLCGHLGDPREQEGISHIVRIVIAGNSVCGRGQDVTLNEKVKLTKSFDDLLAQLSSVCPVDLMPGEFDPANYVMPQQPFHHCLFPQASKLSGMQSVTNPYEFEIEGRICIGTSGQNVNDVRQCSSMDDPIEILENICKWGHLAPSAPDTLVSYPYHKKEPFIINQSPDIIFAGSQKNLLQKLLKVPQNLICC